MAEYPGAIAYYVDPSRVFVGQNSHSALVIHGTGGSPAQTVEQLGDWFRTNDAGVSSHFGIGRDGRVAQYVSLADGAAANCCKESGYDTFWDQFGGDNLNVHTISIEHINDSANSLALTPVQRDASFMLVAWLCRQYGLSMNQIKTHQSIAPQSRARCPGSAFDFGALSHYVQSRGNVANSHITQAAQDTWNSTAFLFGGKPLSYSTGIAQSWQQLYVQKQKLMPPPTTREFDSVDWSGNAITVQYFGNIRCEWNKATNTPAWFNASGGMR
jgi:hypothetical protein